MLHINQLIYETEMLQKKAPPPLSSTVWIKGWGKVPFLLVVPEEAEKWVLVCNEPLLRLQNNKNGSIKVA